MSDKITFEKLFAHRGFLERLARELVFDPAASEDLVQETWLRAIQSPPRDERNVRAWLRRVARNLAAGDRRTAARRQAREPEVARVDRTASTSDVVESRHVSERIVGAVLALKEPYRSTLVYRFYGGLPPRDIARRMDVPVSTVETRTSRALARLRASLDRDFGDRGAWCLPLVPLVGVTGAATKGATAGAAKVVALTQIAAVGVVGVAVVAGVSVFGSSEGQPTDGPEAPRVALADPGAERVRVTPTTAEPTSSDDPNEDPLPIGASERAKLQAPGSARTGSVAPAESVAAPTPAPAPAPPAGAAGVLGRVVSAVSGDPVVGVVVRARALGGGGGATVRRRRAVGGAQGGAAAPMILGGADPSPRSSATTDARGGFALHLAPGRYRLELRGRHFAEATPDLELAEGDVRTLEIPGHLGGTIQVAVQGAGAEGAFVSLLRPDGSYVDGVPATGEEGVTFNGVPPGRYQVKAWARGRSGAKTIEILPEETGRVTLEMKPAPTPALRIGG